MSCLTIGDLKITGLTDIQSFNIPIKTLFPEINLKRFEDFGVIDESIVSKGLIHLTIRSWLLQQKGRLILVDSCVGANKNRPHHPAWHNRSGTEWLTALSEAGFKPEDIDIVMCTHLHADHVGWNTRLENGCWVPTFPNAQYLCGKTEYSYWKSVSDTSDKHGSFADSVLPLIESGNMNFLEDQDEVANGLSVQLSPGHTPGHLCLNSVNGAVFCGDIIHSPIQLRFPELSSAFCSNRDLARTTRENLLLKVAEEDSFLIPAHFPNPGWTKIRRIGKGYYQI